MVKVPADCCCCMNERMWNARIISRAVTVPVLLLLLPLLLPWLYIVVVDFNLHAVRPAHKQLSTIAPLPIWPLLSTIYRSSRLLSSLSLSLSYLFLFLSRLSISFLSSSLSFVFLSFVFLFLSASAWIYPRIFRVRHTFSYIYIYLCTSMLRASTQSVYSIRSRVLYTPTANEWKFSLSLVRKESSLAVDVYVFVNEREIIN